MKKLSGFPYTRVLVLGLAKSGTAAAQLLLESGVKVRINDFKADPDSPEVLYLKESGAEVITGGHPLSVLEDVDYVIKNPGIPYENPVVAEAVNRPSSCRNRSGTDGMASRGADDRGDRFQRKNNDNDADS